MSASSARPISVSPRSMAEINPHPALKAAVPQSPMVDGWMRRRLVPQRRVPHPSLDYAVGQSTAKAEGGGEFAVGAGDDYTRYLEAGFDRRFREDGGIEQYPFMQKLSREPGLHRFLVAAGASTNGWRRGRIRCRRCSMVGQWDQEDSYGAPAVYRALEPKDKNNDRLSLVIGPWRHSGVNHYGYDLGALTFTGDTAHEWRVKYVKPFFDHCLKGAPGPADAAGADLCDRRESVGGSRPRWPMGTAKPLYLAATARHDSTKPGAAGHDEYVSDPAKPVPFIPRPIDMGDRLQWKPWLVHDQRFVVGRPDVPVYTERAARQTSAHHGRTRGGAVRRHHRDRQRLGGETDRRLSERRSRSRRRKDRSRHGRLRTADRHRDLPRPLPRQALPTRRR